MPPESNHRFSFFRAGGVDQLDLKSGADLAALSQLDQKLWVALACPTQGLRFDARTLAAIDADGDGRIRAPEVLAAVEWTLGLLKDPEVLMAGRDELELSSIDGSTPLGAQILASARQILADLGRPSDRTIRLADTTDTAALFAGTNFNGDGIIPPEAAEDEATARAIRDVLACSTPRTDRSARDGVDRSAVQAFFADAATWLAWTDAAHSSPGVLPLGDATAAAADALDAVDAKVRDWFARCRLAAFDSRALDALNREESEFLALAAKDLSITDAEIAGLPLARVVATGPLTLTVGVNPAWADRMERVRIAAVVPLLGDRDRLTEQEWTELTRLLLPYRTWAASKAGAGVESLGTERLRELVTSDAQATIEALLDRDEALAGEAAAIESVDRLLHFNRHLVTLLRNFVSFQDFYRRDSHAIFQAGTLFLDTRSCELCIEVLDPARHATMAPLSRAYIAYCACVRKATGQTMTIAAAFTDGDSDYLMVGRNGVFYDRDGNDWDATITKIVENPLSIRQAFWAPYKRVIRMVEEAVSRRAAEADKAADGTLASGASAAGGAATGGPPPKPKFDVGVVAALGVAVGGITAALGAVMQSVFGLGIWMPLGLIGMVLLISGPSMLLAWIKLRQRNIGPLLDANGWAVNAQAKVNVPFGADLTRIGELPKGSARDLRDPWAARGPGRWIGWVLLLLLVVAGLWGSGTLDSRLPETMRRSTVAPAVAPAEANPAAPAE